jgi:hypothetical protein
MRMIVLLAQHALKIFGQWLEQEVDAAAQRGELIAHLIRQRWKNERDIEIVLDASQRVHGKARCDRCRFHRNASGTHALQRRGPTQWQGAPVLAMQCRQSLSVQPQTRQARAAAIAAIAVDSSARRRRARSVNGVCSHHARKRCRGRHGDCRPSPCRPGTRGRR